MSRPPADSAPDSTEAATPCEGAVERASSAQFSLSARTRVLVGRLEARATTSATALLPEGHRLLATFDRWAWEGPPEVGMRQGHYLACLTWHQAAGLVLGDGAAER